MLQVNQYGALQNLQNLSNIIVFQNYETFNNLAHGQFMEWVEKIGINYKEAQRMMKIVKELPKLDNVVQFGSSVLYLIATLPEEEKPF